MVLKEITALIFTGIFIGLGTPLDKFYLVLGAIIFTWIILLIKIPVYSNERIYLKSISAFIGFILGHLLEVNIISPLGEPDIMTLTALLVVISLIILCYNIPYLLYRWRQRREMLSCGEQNHKKWADRNLFDERVDDLNRLLDFICKNHVATLGLEGERGSGKTFLMEGFVERLQERGYLYITIDVMALRFDKYPEYLIGELDKLLYSQGIVAKNSSRLQRMLQGTKAELFTHIWEDQEKYYIKLFKSFQQELLSLNRHIVLIYEDVDRINNLDAIRNILYLSEKLSSENEYWPDSGIHVIYQYSLKHMKRLGLDNQFLEKYILQRMSLTSISFYNMISGLQRDVPQKARYYLESSDIHRLPPYMLIGRSSPLPQEKEWAEAYFASVFTIRKVKNFLLKVKFMLDNETGKIELSELERNISISMCFIEHFMPETLQRLNVMPLYSAFYISVSDTHAEYMGNICRTEQVAQPSSGQQNVHRELLDMYGEWRDEARRYEYLNPEHHPENFELYIAWRLLGLDGVERLSPVRYADYNEGDGRNDGP